MSCTHLRVNLLLCCRRDLSGREWSSASSAMVESIQWSLAMKGSVAGECVIVEGGEMVNTQRIITMCVSSDILVSLLLHTHG